MRPKVFYVANFASIVRCNCCELSLTGTFQMQEECEHIIDISQTSGYAADSAIVLNTAKDVHTNKQIRSSKSAFFYAYITPQVGFSDEHPPPNRNILFLNGSWRWDDDIFIGVSKRAANLTRLALIKHDPQIVHYQPGQYFNAHYDTMQTSSAETPQRLLTVLLYLNDVKEEHGGATIFPMSNEEYRANQNRVYDESLCEQAGFLSVRPKRGDAVMFYNLQFVLETSIKELGTDIYNCFTLKGRWPYVWES